MRRDLTTDHPAPTLTTGRSLPAPVVRVARLLAAMALGALALALVYQVPVVQSETVLLREVPAAAIQPCVAPPQQKVRHVHESEGRGREVRDDGGRLEVHRATRLPDSQDLPMHDRFYRISRRKFLASAAALTLSGAGAEAAESPTSFRARPPKPSVPSPYAITGGALVAPSFAWLISLI